MNVFIKRITVVFYLLMLLTSTVSQAQDEKFQAIFLYKFIENINWPDAKRNLVVGIVGETSVQDELEKILQTRNNSTISVTKITSAEALSCDIVFLPEEQNSSLHTIVENTSRKSILIVTETAGLIKKGACISFLREKNKLGFAVNKSTLDLRSLRVSSALLNLSQQI
jgi:hypothetical protein